VILFIQELNYTYDARCVICCRIPIIISLLVIFAVCGTVLGKVQRVSVVNISCAFIVLVQHSCLLLAITNCHFVSDIAIFVLKRDVKLQLTN